MIAVLCANIPGEQHLRSILARQEAERYVERCMRRMRLAAENYGGKLLSQGKNGLTFVFPRGSDAFLAAGIIQQRVSDLPVMSGVRPAAGIGIGCRELLDEPDAPQSLLEYLAAKLADIALPAQILFCQEACRLEELPSDAGCKVRPVPESSLLACERKYQVCEFSWQESRGLTPRRLAETFFVRRKQLKLRHRSAEFVLGDDLPVLNIGRHPDCHVILNSRRVSRQHARIERRGNRLVVIDTSANGTYVYQDGHGEIHVHNDERLLSGRGELCIGGPASAADVEKVAFEA